jgi:hypothetical protein
VLLLNDMYTLLKKDGARVADALAREDPLGGPLRGLAEPYGSERGAVASRRAEAYRRLREVWVDQVAPSLTVAQFNAIRAAASRRLGPTVSAAVWGRTDAPPHTALGSAANCIFLHIVCSRLR